MSRLPNVPITILLATARWLMCVDKLTVNTLRLVHKRTATDRIAAVCRFVKAEARQRTRDAVAHGVIAERPSRSAARRTAQMRPTAEAPVHRARSVRAMREPQQAPAPRNADAPHRAMPPQHGPRAAVIAALNAQPNRAHEDRLRQIAEQHRQLRERLEGIERKVAVRTATPVTPAAPQRAPTVSRAGKLIGLVRRCAARARTLLRRLPRARP